jgi:diguanylate cyclase (GGDEF)-like protein
MPRILQSLTFGLSRRLTLVFGPLIGLVVAGAIATNLNIQLDLIDRRLDARAEGLGSLAAEVTSSYLLDMRISDLDVVYEDIYRQPDIAFIYFVNDAGLRLLGAGTAPGGADSFLDKVDDELVVRASETKAPQRRRAGDLEHVARPVKVGDAWLGTVRFAIERAEHNRELLTIWRQNLLVGVLFILAGVLLSWVLARKLTEPLNRLTAMTERAARGEFDQTISVRTNDEIERLALSFNLMLGTVRDSLAQIHDLAYRDKLTHLPNRVAFNQKLEQALSDAGRTGGKVALLFLDLDRFKHLNDSIGHHAGDLLLQEVAVRMLSCVREFEGRPGTAEADMAAGPISVSRLGGDEFTIVMPRLEGTDQAARLAERVLAAIEQPVELEGTMHLGATSIGIAIYPQDGESSDQLLKHADIAMYQAKHAGRNTYRFYDAQMATAALRRLTLERELRVAIEENQFELHLQPQYVTRTGKVAGAEVLIRWRHPQDGLVYPNNFIPLAEEARLMPALGRRVIEASLRLARQWAFFRDAPLRLCINVSVPELEAEGFGEWVAAEVAKAGIDPGTIEFEVTECAAMFDSNRVEAQIARLRAAGIRFAVDDFGVGYSNLARLKRLAFETLKIDRSLMSGVGTDPEAESLVASILRMAEALRLEVVAEGVETPMQLEFLKRHGCQYVQGYLLARPMPSEDFRSWLHTETLASIAGARPSKYLATPKARPPLPRTVRPRLVDREIESATAGA